MNIINKIIDYSKELFKDAAKTWNTVYETEDRDLFVETIKKVVDHATICTIYF
jgi:hypothetical protein